MQDISLIERLLSYYGFPVAFSAALLFIIWKISNLAWKKLEPMLDALTDYFLGLPEYEQRKMAKIEESLVIAKETRERTKAIERGVQQIKVKVCKCQGEEEHSRESDK